MRAGRTIALLAALAASLVAPPAGAMQRRGGAAAQRDWTQTAVRTPEGGFRIGNPAAPVKVIEYLSLTCPHCAAFAHESQPRLFQTYVRSGRVSVEYRNFVLNGYDLAAAFLSRCAEPRQYFALTHYLLAHQNEWAARMQTLTEAQRNELRSLAPLPAMQRLAPLLGLDRIGAQFGIGPAQQRTCLASQAGLDRIEQMITAARNQHQVTGTPTFVINGRPVEANAWSAIEPMLRGQ